MPKSAAFAKIKADVLRAVTLVPAGAVSTYADIGAFLEIMPRHVAYLLATLPEAERDHLPWHRIVLEDGCISPTRFATRGREQIRRLTAEGHSVTDRRIDDFAARRHVWPVTPDIPGRRTRRRYLDLRTNSRFDDRP